MILPIVVNFQVLAALGKDYFDQILPDIIRNCSHQKASVRDGHLTLFRVNLPHSSPSFYHMPILPEMF
jgi:hypothetical protein